MHEEQHLAERMAAMVVDSDDDDGIAGFGDLGSGPGLLGGEEEKKDERIGGIGGGGIGGGGLAPTSRFAAAAANLSKEAEEANAAAAAAEATAATEGGGGDESAKKKKKKKRHKKKKPKGDGEGEEGDDAEDADAKAAAEPEPPKPVTTTEAIGKLKQQEVSIGASTTVQMRRNDSALSLANSDGATGAFDADGQPVINLLQKEDDAAKKGGKAGKKDKKKKGKGKSKALGGNEAENQRAARRFNRSVRGCVENSDAAGLADLLRDKRNHNFALEPSVLETVMKAYVVAAMFEDALCKYRCMKSAR